MKKRDNDALENYRSLHENRLLLLKEEMRKIDESASKRDDFINNYYAIREHKARKEAQRANLMEAARNDALATVIKAIYITAMEAEALMDENIILAESMVDKWIEESGGASKILAKTGNNTYLLSRITQIVEDAAEETVKEIEDNPEAEDQKENSTASKDVQIAQLTAKDAEIKAQIANLKAEKKAEDEEEKESEDVAEEGEVEDTEAKKSEETDPQDDGDDSNNEAPLEPEEKKESEDAAEDSSDMKIEDIPAESEDEPASNEDKKKSEEDDALEDPEDEKASSTEESDETGESEDEKELTDGKEVDPDESAEEDDDVTDAIGEPVDPSNTDATDISVDSEPESNGKIFDELEKEEDVQKAIEIIRSRVADAEETFIKNNAEDKKKIDELLNKISNNVKTIETLSEKDPKKAEVATEAVREYKKKINDIYHEKSFTIFGKMTSILTENIVKDKVVRESYLAEDGTLDVDLAVESAKVMYGFLETLNTIQIVKVDENYIADIISGMK